MYNNKTKRKPLAIKRENDFKEAEAQERATDNAGCGAILLLSEEDL